jgi:hypothetical protein
MQKSNDSRFKEERRRKRRKTTEREKIGPIIEWANKSLISYGKGVKKTYYSITIPNDFIELNSKEIQKNKVNLYYSSECKGYLLLSFLPPISQTVAKNLECEINLENVKKILYEESYNPNIVGTFLRELLFARIEQGFRSIVIKTTVTSDFEQMDQFLRIIEEVGDFASKTRSSWEKSIIIKIQDDPKQIAVLKNVNIFDFKGLTTFMWDEVVELLNDVIDAIKNKDSDAEDRFKGREAFIDFLWCYSCRQLIRATRYGLFCGSGKYTSITPVALGSFFKLLEHSGDHIMGILKAVCECLKKLPREGQDKEDVNNFLNKLIEKLNEVKENLERVKGPLLNSIENNLSEEDLETIADILKQYHTKIRPKVGCSGESYLEGAGLLGEFEDLLKGMETEKAVILSQALYPLQKISKFPANVAMLARILCSSVV